MAKKKTGKRKLTVKQKKFAKLYAAGGNATQSAKLAGYSKKAASSVAYETLKNPQVKKAIHEALEESLAKAQLKSDHVIEQLRRIAFADIADMYNEKGKVKELHEISDEARTAIQSLETDELIGPQGIRIGKRKKLKLSDKAKALELLGKSFGIFTDVVESKGNITVVTADEAQVKAAREKILKDC